MELREGAAQTEAFRVAGVNSGDERSHKAIQEFGAELPAHECGDGLINFRSAGGAEALRSEFQQKSIAPLRTNYASYARRGFQHQGIDSRFVEGVRADQARD